MLLRCILMTKRLNSLEEEVWRHFKDFRVIFLATSERDQPRVRPVTLVYLDGRFWIVTGTNNAKTKQIRKNPKMEFCLFLEKGENRGYIRGAGLAQIIKDRETRAKIAKQCSFFSDYYGSSEDPNYTLIQLKITEIEYLRPRYRLRAYICKRKTPSTTRTPQPSQNLFLDPSFTLGSQFKLGSGRVRFKN